MITDKLFINSCKECLLFILYNRKKYINTYLLTMYSNN